MIHQETVMARRCRDRVAYARRAISDALRELSVPSVDWTRASVSALCATLACMDVADWCRFEMRHRDGGAE